MAGPQSYADGVPEMKDFPELQGRRFIAVPKSEEGGKSWCDCCES